MIYNPPDFKWLSLPPSWVSSFIFIAAYFAFSLSPLHFPLFIKPFTSRKYMPRLWDGQRERTTVCCTAGLDRRTRGTDAQVTTLPGVMAITPSELKIYFYTLWGRFCKPVISCLKASAVRCFRLHPSIHFCLLCTQSSSIEPSVKRSICFLGCHFTVSHFGMFSQSVHLFPPSSLFFIICHL